MIEKRNRAWRERRHMRSSSFFFFFFKVLFL